MSSNIIRAPHNADRPYFATAKSAAQDNNLSFAARGLLWYILSKPDNWRIIIKDVMKSGGIGRDKAYTLLDELKGHGYITRERTRRPDGTFVWGDYRIMEAPGQPQNVAPELDEDEPLTEKPEVDAREPLPCLPYTVKPEIRSLNTETTEKTTASAVAGSENQEVEPVTPDDHKRLSGLLLELAYMGNAKMWSMAALVANWMLCRDGHFTNPHTKHWINWKPDHPFTLIEALAFLLWYADLKIAWPSSPQKWNGKAFEFRKDARRGHYLKLAKERLDPSPVENQPTDYERAMAAANQAAEQAAA